MEDQDLYELAVHLHTKNQHKELTTLLFLIKAMNVHGNTEVEEVSNDPTKVLQHVNGGTKTDKVWMELSQVSVINLIEEHSKQSESLIWEELKSVSNTFRECSIFPNKCEFTVNIPHQFEYFVNGMIHVFMRIIAQKGINTWKWPTNASLFLQQSFLKILLIGYGYEILWKLFH